MPTFLSNSDYYSHLQSNLGVLVNSGKIGLSKFEPDDVQAKLSKQLELIKGFKNYHFYVNVPYAGKILNWEIIFDPDDFSELPDFDFNDYNFLSEPDINYIADNIPSWDKWDLTDPKSVLIILNEFLELYKKTQIEKLYENDKYSNLKEQYEELLTTLNLSSDKVEFQIEMKSEPDYVETDDFNSVRFFIELPVDCTPLPDYCLVDNGIILDPGHDCAYLSLQMKKADNSQTKAAVHLSTRLEDTIGKLKLPKLSKDNTIAHYAQSVQSIIQNQIKTVADRHKIRCTFISAIVNSFSNSNVEYDANRYSKVCFIYEDVEDFDCLVTIQLGATFPNERPKIQLQSLYCQLGRTCNHIIIFIYHPDSSEEDNVTLLRDQLRTEVNDFRNHKH